MTAKDFFFGIDGTGDSNNAAYRTNFADSHVRTMWRTWPVKAYYQRGPSNSGYGTGDQAAEAARYATAFWKENKDANSAMGTRIFLAGYSRGGAAVVEAAYLLSKKDIPVHALLLFDAVDRATGITHSDEIPSNVTLCFHARRAASAGSREMFGSTGYRYERKWTQYKENFFHGSHGAIGGTPWKIFNKRDEVQEFTDGQMILGMAAAGTNPAAQREVILNTYTNVNRQEEAAASLAAGSWMQLGLEEARSTMAAITVVGRRQHGASGGW